MTGRRRRPALAAAAVVLCLGGALLAAAAPATGAAAPDASVGVLLDGLSPRVVRPGDTVRVTGRVVNHGDTALSDVRVRVRVRTTAIGSRSELTAAAVRETPLGDALLATTTPVAGTLGPGAAAAYALTVSADDLRLGSRFGVYPFAVEALADDALGPNDVVGAAPTFLPWVPPGDTFTPTRVAWVWPLVDVPNRRATADYPDDHLAGALTSGGRLSTLLAAALNVAPSAARFRSAPPAAPPATPTPAATPPPRVTPVRDTQRPVPVTYAVDPALLQAAADMSDGYDVRAPGSSGKAVEGTGRAASGAWLALLRGTLRPGGNAVFALPYADVDVSALARAALDPDITAALTRGRDVATSVLGVEPDPQLAWPAGGFISPRALDDLAGGGVRSLVLADAAVPLTAPLSYTPGAGAAVDSAGGALRALLYDTTLARVTAAADRGTLAAAATQSAAAPATASPDGEPAAGSSASPQASASPLAVVPPGSTPRLVEQRFLAETALITAERPGESRDVVVVPPRRWDPDPGLAADLLADTGRVPWLTPITVAQVRAAGGGDRDVARSGLAYPDDAAAAELPASYLTGPSGVAALRRSLAVFRSVLAPPVGPTALALDYATLRTESSAWREDRATGVALRDDVAATLRDQRGRVRISSSRRLITLASRRGTIPVTIVNDLDQAVVVRLQLKATSNARLSAPDSAPQTVAAGHKVTYEVDAVVNQAGLFPVTVRLLTADKRPYGPDVTFRLRSTAYGQLAVGITAGALGVLLLAVIVRLFRRARHARRRDRVAVTGDTDPT